MTNPSNPMEIAKVLERLRRMTGEPGWLTFYMQKAEAQLILDTITSLTEAADGIVTRMASTYRARNGREVGIQGDDGEKCWIVHSDDITILEAALAKACAPDRQALLENDHAQSR